MVLRRLRWNVRPDPEFVDGTLHRRRGSRVLVAALVALALAGAGAAIALAADADPSPPQAQPLDQAIAHALSGRPVAGVSADVTFTSNLFPAGTVLGKLASGLLSGSGHLWLSSDGQGRVEVQTGAGPVQVVWDATTLSVYVAALNTVYRSSLPALGGSTTTTGPPSLTRIDHVLAEVGVDWTISQPQPSVAAGEPAYSVTLSPKESASTLSSLALTWDADHAVPLRIAVYARGMSTPALELDVTRIAYGSVAPSDLQATFPAGATVTDLGTLLHATPSGPAPGSAGFPVSAPNSLAGIPRSSVHLRDGTAIVSYGHDLGGIVLIERKTDASPRGQSAPAFLPVVTVDGITAHELSTTLGTALTWQAAGVTYVLAGSLPSATLESALPAVHR